MKVCISLLLVATTLMAFRMLPDLEKSAEECAKGTSVDLSQFKPGEKPDMALFQNKEYQCFGKCMAVKFGYVNDNGEPNLDNIKAHFNPEAAVIDKIKQCAEENKEAEVCEKVFKTHECIIKNAKA